MPRCIGKAGNVQIALDALRGHWFWFVLLGVGVSNPAQAAEAAAAADGVIVGSALVRRLLEGEGPRGAAAFVASLRAGLDR